MRRRWFKGNTFCSGSCVFDIKTDTRTNKRRSLLTRGTLSLLPPVSFYLKAFSPTNFLLQLDLRGPRLACVRPIIHRETLSGGSRSRISVNSPVLLFRATNVCWCLLSLFKKFLFSLRKSIAPLQNWTGSRRTSGDDSGRVSAADHMWFIILRLAFPGQIGLCIFSDGPMHIHGPGCDDTRVRWKCFQCLCSSSKASIGNTADDAEQEAPRADPRRPHLLTEPHRPRSAVTAVPRI